MILLIFISPIMALFEKLIQSNLFDQVGHPDVIKLYSIDPGYDLHPTYHHIAHLANRIQH